MDRETINARLEELSLIARTRQSDCDGIFSATLGGSEIVFLTPAELQERHELMLMPPHLRRASAGGTGAHSNCGLAARQRGKRATQADSRPA